MTSRPLTLEEYKLILQTMCEPGHCGFRPNPTIALILMIEGSCGLRINDCLRIRLCDIYKTSDNKFRIKIKEQKTGKYRDSFFYDDLYYKLSEYCVEHGRKKDEPIFQLSSRQVNKYLNKITSYLGLSGNISSHSFRKLFATEIFRQSDIYTISTILNHSNINTTARYLSQNPNIDSVLEKCGGEFIILDK